MSSLADQYNIALQRIAELERELAEAPRLRALKEENRTLRGLIACGNCGEPLGDSDPAGWMPGMCLDCQAASWVEAWYRPNYTGRVLAAIRRMKKR